MRGYSESRLFSQPLLDLLEIATEFVAQLEAPETVRCHELTRAVGKLLGLPRECVQDGYYGFADHSWLWVPGPPDRPITKRLGWPHILDVYCVGQLPMVRLVYCDNPGLPHVGWSYRPDRERTDIDEKLVERLVKGETKHEGVRDG